MGSTFCRPRYLIHTARTRHEETKEDRTTRAARGAVVEAKLQNQEYDSDRQIGQVKMFKVSFIFTQTAAIPRFVTGMFRSTCELCQVRPKDRAVWVLVLSKETRC